MHSDDQQTIEIVRAALRDDALHSCPQGVHYSLEADDGQCPDWDLSTLLDYLEDCGAIDPIHDREAVTEQVATDAQHLNQAGHLGRTPELAS